MRFYLLEIDTEMIDLRFISKQSIDAGLGTAFRGDTVLHVSWLLLEQSEVTGLWAFIHILF